MINAWAAAVFLAIAMLPAQEADDVAGVVSEDLKAGGDANKRYFLIGTQKKAAKPPAAGYKLAIIMPGGPGTADFHTFVKRIWKFALSEDYLAVQPVAIKWKDDQEIVWPTKKSPVPGMKFTTEEFVETIVKEVAKRYKLDPRYVFSLSWSSSGPAAYALSLQEKRIVTGSFVSQSVFVEEKLPPLKNAKGLAYYLHHSPADKTCPIDLARKARDELKKQGAKVEFAEYEGGHGWNGDMYGQIKTGFTWLEKATSR
jgi:predicted esterase